MTRLALLLSLSLCACAPVVADDVALSQAAAGFWDHWGDGSAELAGYRLTQPRYGQARRGEAVFVTVTEEFTRATRVKSDIRLLTSRSVCIRLIWGMLPFSSWTFGGSLGTA